MKSELNHYIKSVTKYGEIALFREMQRYLSTKYSCIFIEETHQHYVKFKSVTTQCLKKRELSDLWLIAYSPIQQKTRMTFLQAKLKKEKHTLPFNFSGDYYQYNLLSTRPQIKDAHKFGFPDDILSSAISDSVGSFGVFYFDVKEDIDFAYSTASDISYNSLPKVNCKTKGRQLYFKDITCSDIQIIPSSGIELRCTINADCFEFCLLNLLVGTPIEKDKAVINFLIRYFKSITSSEGIESFINFLSTLGTGENELNSGNEPIGNPNILLLNVDSI